MEVDDEHGGCTQLVRQLFCCISLYSIGFVSFLCTHNASLTKNPDIQHLGDQTCETLILEAFYKV